MGQRGEKHLYLFFFFKVVISKKKKEKGGIFLDCAGVLGSLNNVSAC